MKKYFNPALYIDALRQLRVVGVTYIVILEISAILSCISLNITYSRGFLSKSYFPAPTLLRANPLMLLIVLVFSPILTLVLFHFLNKRNASDVYHSLPDRRASLFLSLFAAVLSWIAAGVLLSTVTSAAGMMFFMPPAVTFDASSVPVDMFYFIAAGFFIAAVVAFSMSITGTLFTNITVAALITLAPRLLILVFTSSLKSLLPILPEESLPEILSSQNNPVFFVGSSIFSGANNSVTVFQLIYALVVFIIYTAAALFLFRGRKSETADKSATNRILQAVFRITFAMVVCLIPCMTILNSTRYDLTTGTTLFSILVFYVIAVVVYFLYELITTRKAGNLLRAIPALGILLILNIAFLGGVSAVRELTLREKPEADEITGVRFLRLNIPLYGQYGSGELKDLRFEDTEIKQIISDTLKDTVYNLKNTRTYLQDRLCTVKIELNGRSITRRLSIPDGDYNKIFNILFKRDDFKKIYKILPDVREVRFSLNGNPSALNSEETARLYEILRKEVNSLEFSVWFQYLRNNTGPYSGGSPRRADYIYLTDSLSVYSEESGENYFSQYFPLSSLLPKTVNFYMTRSNRKADGSMINSMREITQDSSYIVYGFNFKDTNGTPKDVNLYIDQGYVNKFHEIKTLFGEIADLCEDNLAKEVDITKPIWFILDKRSGKYLYVNSNSSVLPQNLPEESKSDISYPTTNTDPYYSSSTIDYYNGSTKYGHYTYYESHTTNWYYETKPTVRSGY